MQLDIEVSFKMPDVNQGWTPPELLAESGELVCSQQGAAMKGMYGPFGVLVLATDDRREQTAVYFYFVHSKLNGWKTLVCSDQSRYATSVGLVYNNRMHGNNNQHQ
jgi:beta-fructofuranosidase